MIAECSSKVVILCKTHHLSHLGNRNIPLFYQFFCHFHPIILDILQCGHAKIFPEEMLKAVLTQMYQIRHILIGNGVCIIGFNEGDQPVAALPVFLLAAGIFPRKGLHHLITAQVDRKLGNDGLTGLLIARLLEGILPAKLHN